MKNKIIIIGCGGHARSVANIILMNDEKAELLFVDKNARDNEYIYGFKVDRSVDKNTASQFVAIGCNRQRMELSAEKPNMSVISRDAFLGIGSVIEAGSFIGQGVHLGPEVFIGKGTIINTHAVIEHETKIGSFCHIAPNTTVCGRVDIGDNVFIGAGTIIKESINICSDVVIGAGSVVIKDIVESGTYVGNPVRKIT